MISAKEFNRRARILEEKGLEISLIGRKPLPLKVRKERALQRYVQHLIRGDSAHGIGIAVSGVPQIKGSHISLAVTLEIPLSRRKLRLSKQDRRLFEILLVQAIEGKGQFVRATSPSRPSRRAHRTVTRRDFAGS
jgi:hypothetical protein